jgi:probable addiction module antidote protein
LCFLLGIRRPFRGPDYHSLWTTQRGADHEDGDTAVIAAALGDVVRARNISKLSRETGLSREGIYKALSGEGNPSFATIGKIADALGLRISFQPNHQAITSTP